ncbi:hypothetical protein C9J85_06320 [Haloferax sp. wsp5]|nr:hypothetical protein C9J85_06320 [Haloferax sp. wsp5]
MRAIDDRKATLGITESSLARAHIDRVACYLDVGSLHPYSEEAGNAQVVRLLKEVVTLLKTVERQFRS